MKIYKVLKTYNGGKILYKIYTHKLKDIVNLNGVYKTLKFLRTDHYFFSRRKAEKVVNIKNNNYVSFDI